MAEPVLLIRAEQGEGSLGARNLEASARLGVTAVSLACDERLAAVILEGWAFDPSQHAEALAAFGAPDEKAQALQPVVQMAVTNTTNPGGTHP